jgi:hypothetical protein
LINHWAIWYLCTYFRYNYNPYLCITGELIRLIRRLKIKNLVKSLAKGERFGAILVRFYSWIFKYSGLRQAEYEYSIHIQNRTWIEYSYSNTPLNWINFPHTGRIELASFHDLQRGINHGPLTFWAALFTQTSLGNSRFGALGNHKKIHTQQWWCLSFQGTLSEARRYTSTSTDQSTFSVKNREGKDFTKLDALPFLDTADSFFITYSRPSYSEITRWRYSSSFQASRYHNTWCHRCRSCTIAELLMKLECKAGFSRPPAWAQER